MNTTTQRNSYLAMTSEELKPLADADDSEALYQLGFRHFTGNGSHLDHKAAFALWNKAAGIGHSLAQNNLGFMYASGQGAPQNDKMAFHWYRKAAEQGNNIGQVNLGKMFAHGLGTKEDYNKAKLWFEKSAAQGNVEAASLLQDLEERTMSPRNTFIVFLIVLAIIPWAMFYMVYLAPSVNHFLGLDRLPKLKIGFYIIPILVPPVLLLWGLFRKSPD